MDAAHDDLYNLVDDLVAAFDNADEFGRRLDRLELFLAARGSNDPLAEAGRLVDERLPRQRHALNRRIDAMDANELEEVREQIEAYGDDDLLGPPMPDVYGNNDDDLLEPPNPPPAGMDPDLWPFLDPQRHPGLLEPAHVAGVVPRSSPLLDRSIINRSLSSEANCMLIANALEEHGESLMRVHFIEALAPAVAALHDKQPAALVAAFVRQNRRACQLDGVEPLLFRVRRRPHEVHKDLRAHLLSLGWRITADAEVEFHRPDLRTFYSLHDDALVYTLKLKNRVGVCLHMDEEEVTLRGISMNEFNFKTTSVFSRNFATRPEGSQFAVPVAKEIRDMHDSPNLRLLFFSGLATKYTEDPAQLTKVTLTLRMDPGTVVAKFDLTVYEAVQLLLVSPHQAQVQNGELFVGQCLHDSAQADPEGWIADITTGWGAPRAVSFEWLGKTYSSWAEVPKRIPIRVAPSKTGPVEFKGYLMGSLPAHSLDIERFGPHPDGFYFVKANRKTLLGLAASANVAVIELPPPPIEIRHIPRTRAYEEECAICKNTFEEGPLIYTNCEHYFHASCLDQWKAHAGDRKCPLCRQDVDFYCNLETQMGTATKRRCWY